MWILLKGRMLTRDRLRLWGLVVPEECLLCGRAVETSIHLFFECQFSHSVWRILLSKLRLHLPTQLEEIVLWLTSVPLRKEIKSILKLVFQAAVYFIWKERNSRLHSGLNKPTWLIVKEIHLQIRAKLLALDRENTLTTTAPRRRQKTYLST